MEDFLRACQAAVLENEAKTLAGKMGLAHVSLLQRANPDNDAHKLTINQLFQILLHTGDHRPLAALAAEFGFDLMAREKPAAVALTSAAMSMSAEVADVQRAVHDALADGHVSQVEKQILQREITGARASLDVLAESVRAA